MSITVECDRCGREIYGDRGEADADGIRVPIPRASKKEDQQYLYITVGDEDGEPTENHVCAPCAAAVLGGGKSVIRSEPEEDDEASKEPEVDETESSEEHEDDGEDES